MHATQYHVKLVGSLVEEAIFDACRANPNREPRGRVAFRALPNGEHEATLRNADGQVVATAIVDKWDN